MPESRVARGGAAKECIVMSLTVPTFMLITLLLLVVSAVSCYHFHNLFMITLLVVICFVLLLAYVFFLRNFVI